MAAGRRPGEPCRRRLERWQACWCGWRAIPRVPASPSGRRRTHPSRRPGRRSGCSRGASSAPPRLGPCARGPSRCSSACRKTRSPASTGSPRRRRPLRFPPCAVGLVSGSMIFSCSMIEPGHPCVDDERQRILMLRTNVNEMNVQPVDLGDELRQGVQLRLAPCASRSPSPSSARAPASSRAARPATDR